jgi:acetyl-CoA acetyltransferase
MMDKAWILGVGMVKFQKPGASDPYPKMASEAVRAALTDAGLGYEAIEQVYAGYVYGDSTAGQRAVYDVGLSGVPIVNVNNNCSTGSTALMMARQAVLAGADCVLAVGFEQMERGALGTKYTDRVNPLDRHFSVMNDAQGLTEAPPAAQMFGGAGREHRWKYGTKTETFAKIAEKARRHAGKNPYALFTEAMTVEAILASPSVFEPLTRAQCCPPTCGAAAAIVVSERFAKKSSAAGNAIRIDAQTMTSDTQSTFEGSMIRMVGFEMAARAAKRAYEQAGIGPNDVQVIELHDCFTTNELLTYEALGLVGEGQGEKLVDDGDNTYGGKWVVNPSGGLLSKGHPLGATGLAQCTELVWQLRGAAGDRQVSGARIALQHNIGLGGACVVSIYSKN